MSVVAAEDEPFLAAPSLLGRQKTSQSWPPVANRLGTRQLRRHGSSPGRAIEPMVSIPEERGELAMEIAQDVIQGLDIDRKLDERMHEVFHRGDWFLQEMKVQQEQSTHALHRSVKMCLESQRLFHEEHQSLLNAVKQL